MTNGYSTATPSGSGASSHPTDGAIHPSLTGVIAESVLQSLVRGFHATSILITTPDGTILFANSVAINGFPEYTIDSIIGANLIDLAPKAWAEERIGYLKLAIERARPVLVIEILVGTRLSSTISPINSGPDNKDGLLLITVEQITPMKLRLLRERKDPDDLFDAQIVDLGRLAVLSPRELEVAALMGQGLRQKQIAEQLHRSVSTIDRHRERIGEKLGITDRIELVALAREAALEMADANRTHVSFGHPRFNTEHVKHVKQDKQAKHDK